MADFNPPISRLYPDVWTSIANFLDVGSILNLIGTGNESLASVLRRSVRSIAWNPNSSVFGIDGFFKASRHFASIDRMSICSNLSINLVRVPSKPLNLTANLTSLSLRFNGVFTLVPSLHLSSSLPKLIELELVTEGEDHPFALEDLELPPRLEALKLQTNRLPSLTPGFVARLPRSLTSLSFHSDFPTLNPLDREIGVASKSPFCWPPSLHRLAIHGSQNVVLDHLPRTLSELDLQQSTALITNFPPSKNGFVFPWRRFFPRLNVLDLPMLEDRLCDLSLLLASIVHPGALDSAIVEKFLASASAIEDSPTELIATDHASYPHFRQITLHQSFWEKKKGTMEEILSSVAPLIVNTKFTTAMLSPDLFKYLPHVSTVQLLSGHQIIEKLPPSITTLSCPAAPVSYLPPSLTTLKARTIAGTGKGGKLEAHNAFPSTLLHLNIYGFSPPPELAHALPTTLTLIYLEVTGPDVWQLLVERLINLIRLHVTLGHSWSPKAPLARVASSQLRQFSISTLFLSSIIPLEGFFSNPPILPPGLDSLIIEPVCHVSLLPMLPRSLRVLQVDEMLWLGEEPKDTQMNLAAKKTSQEELLRGLPPNLRELYIGGVVDRDDFEATQPKPGLKILKFLPRSLLSFSCFHLLDIPNSLELKDIAHLLPKNLTQLVLETASFSVDFLRPQGFLY